MILPFFENEVMKDQTFLKKGNVIWYEEYDKSIIVGVVVNVGENTSKVFIPGDAHFGHFNTDRTKEGSMKLNIA